MTSILVWGSIFDGLRNWISKHSTFISDLLSCTLCTSTWVGFFLSIVLGSLTKNHITLNYHEYLNNFIYTFMDGMFTAGAVWCVNSIVEFFEESRIK